MSGLLSSWPNILFALVTLYLVVRFVGWVDPLSSTPAEEARREGRLVHDELGGGSWVEIEPLECRHTHVKIFSDGEIVCQRCGERR